MKESNPGQVSGTLQPSNLPIDGNMRFCQQFKRGCMSYWSHIFLSWASCEFQTVGLILKLFRKLWANTETVTEKVTDRLHPSPLYRCTSAMSACPGQAPGPTCFCTDCRWFPSLLAAPHKSYQLINGQQKKSCSWTVPDFWQQCLTKEKFREYGGLVTVHCNESSNPYCLQDH